MFKAIKRLFKKKPTIKSTIKYLENQDTTFDYTIFDNCHPDCNPVIDDFREYIRRVNYQRENAIEALLIIKRWEKYGEPKKTIEPLEGNIKLSDSEQEFLERLAAAKELEKQQNEK